MPTGRSAPPKHARGLLDTDQHKIIAERMAEGGTARTLGRRAIDAKSYDEILADPQRLAKVVKGDRPPAVHDNCAACHGGRDGAAATTIPDLADHDWIWAAGRKRSPRRLCVGVNSANPDSRASQCPPSAATRCSSRRS